MDGPLRVRLAPLALGLALLVGGCVTTLPEAPRVGEADVRAAIAAKDVSGAKILARDLSNEIAASPDPRRSLRAAAPLLRFLLDAAQSDDALRLARAAVDGADRVRLDDAALEADLVNALGEATYEAGDGRAALRDFERSLALRERALGPDHPLVAESLNNRAVVRKNLGDLAAARADYERSLRIREKRFPPEHAEVLESVDNLAMLHLETGDYARAEAAMKRSLAARETADAGALVTADTLARLGELYRLIGAYDRALPLHERSLAIRRKQLGGDHARVGEALNNIALIHHARGDLKRAEATYREAIAVFARSGGGRNTAVASLQNNLGLLLLGDGRAAEAEALLDSALAMRRELLGDRHPRTARSMDNLAKARLARGDLDGARALLGEALSIVEGSEDPDARWRVLDTARRLEERRGSPLAAIVFGKRAVNGLQSMRLKLRDLDPALQRTFLADKADAYRALIDLLVAEGRLPEAQQVVRMLKEEEYFDFIQRGGATDPRTASLPLSVGEKAGIEGYERAGERVALLAKEQQQLRSREKPGTAEVARLKVLDDELRSARRDFDGALGEIHRYFTSDAVVRERAVDIGRMNLPELRALQGTLEALGEGVVTLHYVVFHDKVKILLTTPRVQVARDSPIAVADLNKAVHDFRALVQRPDRNPVRKARELYDLLVAPIAGELDAAGARTLMLSLDGVLRYLPFAALHDGERYLVERYRLAVFTEAARDKLREKSVPEWKAAAFGLTKAVEGFNRLPGVAEELRSIVKTPGSARGVVPGRIVLDEDFSREAVLHALQEEYPVLHLASHFVFQAGAELDSFLLLGDRTRLTLRDLRDNDFDFRHVELIALSACETAIGGGSDRFGREIEGLAVLVQRQGAKSVMATLWEVYDDSTSELMRAFYEQRMRGLSKAEALRRAQLALLGGSQYRHPFFWAPFLIAGNWL